ncbi:hypothetical protein [Clostridium sp. N3C]|uniref:hypothetical protein n=1 Tax=Clostridium sp. N3C TaxID=1776758 RepID=UPI003594936C
MVGLSQRNVIENYYADINNLADLLTKLVNSYRLLIAGANELNNISLAHRRDIKDALNRASDLGKVIDHIVDALKDTDHAYVNYCKLKTTALKEHLQLDYIKDEIDNELKL